MALQIHMEQFLVVLKTKVSASLGIFRTDGYGAFLQENFQNLTVRRSKHKYNIKTLGLGQQHPFMPKHLLDTCSFISINCYQSFCGTCGFERILHIFPAMTAIYNCKAFHKYWRYTWQYQRYSNKVHRTRSWLIPSQPVYARKCISNSYIKATKLLGK